MKTILNHNYFHSLLLDACGSALQTQRDLFFDEHQILSKVFGTHCRSQGITDHHSKVSRKQKTSRKLKNGETNNIAHSEKQIFEKKMRNEDTDSLVWLTSSEAADLLGISTKSLLNMTSNGKIPYYKLDRRNRYLKADLNKLLLQNRRGPIYGN